MATRRHLRRAQLFDQRPEISWMVAEDPWGKIVGCRQLEAGADLLRVFVVEILSYHDAGWRLIDFSAYSAQFFCTKAGEVKRHVFISIEDPHTCDARPMHSPGGFSGAQ